ncbi:hypothetical protein KUTeg_022019 [Tegillarca granosa]|uniref:Novel STAND NTPase 3 domain-containing protein n=1 Tax=Tegillarca granosa TaxID=220873 RepID=A0ABQ9E5U3_TEGGR|nr:hypothetical protein KUTeg_022019 [Tegillarca granosa]
MILIPDFLKRSFTFGPFLNTSTLTLELFYIFPPDITYPFVIGAFTTSEVSKHKSITTSMEAAVTSRLEKVEGSIGQKHQENIVIEILLFDSNVFQVEAVKTYTEGHIKDLATEFDDNYNSVVRELKKDDSVFVTTRGTQTVKNAIKNNSIVTVTGNIGAGKTATVNHVAIELENEGYQILPVVSPELIHRYLQKSKKQVFILEDPIGKHTLDKDIFRVWLLHNKILLSVISNNTKMLCSMRKVVTNDPDFKIENNIFNKTIIDLQDNENQLNEKEKLEIIMRHFEIKKIDFPISKQAKIIFAKVKDLFPLLCKLFSAKQEFRVVGWDFFSNPFPVILEDLSKMHSNIKVKYDVLVLCFAFGNLLDSNLFSLSNPLCLRLSNDPVIVKCDIDLRIPMSEFSKAAESLVGVYFKKEAGIYKFSHDLIFDVVAFHFGRTCPQLLLKVGSSKFICNRVLVNKSHAQNNDPNVIILSSDNYVDLIKRLLDDLKNGIYNYSIMNKCWDDDEFLKSFIDFVTEQQEVDFEMFIKANQMNIQLIVQEYENIGNDDPISTWSWYYIAINLLSSTHCTALHWIVTFRQKKLFSFLWKNLTSNKKKHVCEKIPLLHFAFLGGDLEICKEMLSIESNKYNEPLKKLLPLHCAAIRGNADAVKLLIDRVVDFKDQAQVINQTSSHLTDKFCKTMSVKKFINTRGINGITALMFASDNASFTVVELLLQNGAKIDLCDNDGSTSLMLASQNGHSSVVELLLQNGAKIDLCDNDGSTSLMLASQNGHSSVVELLLQNGAKIDLCDNVHYTSLMFSSLNGHSSVVELLLQNGANIDLCDNRGETSLMLASLNGHSSVVELLLQNGAKVNLWSKDCFTSLMLASENGHSSVVGLLLQNGAKVDLWSKDCSTSLILASENGHSSVVELLLQNGAKVDLWSKDCFTSLMLASQNGHSSVVGLLLQNGAKIDLCHNYGFHSLMFASFYGHSSVVELLLQNGAKIDLCNKHGFTSLMLASHNGHSSVVELLLKIGAKIDLRGKNGFSSLMLASQNGHSNVVELLLKNGAKIDLHGKNGFTSSMLASQNGHSSVVELLLQNGAKIDLCNKNGSTALMLASHNGHSDVVQLLLQNGAMIDL